MVPFTVVYKKVIFMITAVCLHYPSVNVCPSVCGGRAHRGQSSAVSPSFHLVMGSRYQPGLRCQQFHLHVALSKVSTEKQFCTFACSTGGIQLSCCRAHIPNATVIIVLTRSTPLSGSRSNHVGNYPVIISTSRE